VLPSQENTHENTLPDTDLLEADGDAFHLIEDDDYRDNDEVYCRESDSSSDSEDEAVAQHNDSDSRVPLYPGATITVTESIISIMKYSLKHKMTYAAVNDLLGLLSLHLPYGSDKEHLKSLYFLKKAFNSKGDQDEIVTVNYYCQSCFSGPLQSSQNICSVCGNTNLLRRNNYFLTLDIAGQIKQMFQGKFDKKSILH
jgi:hypothetical protein